MRDDPPPFANSIEFLGIEPLLGVLFEREGSEQVLTHEPVLELGCFAQHVDQRLAVLDHKRCLGRGEATARSYDLSQPPPPGWNRVLPGVTHRSPHALRTDRQGSVDFIPAPVLTLVRPCP